MNPTNFPGFYQWISLIYVVLCVGCSASRPAPIRDQSTQMNKAPVIVVPQPTEAKQPQKTTPKPPAAVENKKTPVEPVPPVDSSFRIGKPSSGPVIDVFNGTTNKGVEYGGKIGDPVVAAADGNVIFSGNSLRSYGNLVIVKHNNSYISVYAHNSKNLVKEGDVIKRGQKIAEMGNSETDRVKLHFELRRESKPIDPLGYFDN